jgi:hypothetical protein
MVAYFIKDVSEWPSIQAVFGLSLMELAKKVDTILKSSWKL